MKYFWLSAGAAGRSAKGRGILCPRGFGGLRRHKRLMPTWKWVPASWCEASIITTVRGLANQSTSHFPKIVSAFPATSSQWRLLLFLESTRDRLSEGKGQREEGEGNESDAIPS